MARLKNKICTLALLVCASSIFAQPANQVSAEFSTLSWDQAIHDIYYLDGEDRIDISIPNGAPSNALKGPTQKPLIFYKDGALGPDGKPTPVPVAQTNLTSGKPLLLVFFDQANSAMPYRIAAIVNETQTSTQDTYQLHNISSHQVVAQFDGEKITIDPGKHLLMESPQTDGPNFGVMMAIQADTKASGQWKLVYKAFWPYRAGRSSLVFITNKADKADQISVRRFYVSTPAPTQS